MKLVGGLLLALTSIPKFQKYLPPQCTTKIHFCCTSRGKKRCATKSWFHCTLRTPTSTAELWFCCVTRFEKKCTTKLQFCCTCGSQLSMYNGSMISLHNVQWNHTFVIHFFNSLIDRNNLCIKPNFIKMSTTYWDTHP